MDKNCSISENIDNRICFKTYLIIGKKNKNGETEKFPYVDQKKLYKQVINEKEWEGFHLI